MLYALLALIIIYLAVNLGLRWWTTYSLKRHATVLTSEAFESQSRGEQIIDLRDPADFKAKHVLGARNIQLQLLLQNPAAIRKDKPVFFVDANNQGAASITRKLAKQGYPQMFVLKGGMSTYTGKTK
ncbi:rhodanese-like domain-containing protein [Weissella diestrammenae]|uniref:Rhodanese-like domain-containing protein n=1 Tax=Weissella diestrammenae TaxID=1162633 RepID=A0A7G9T3U3_9LACO|nr:rhodanese-like domain-containing protein [Weissella diestrammenae]MCM0582755.1 rhodanese-like domain-containing protein [Weissella diestrammenae]QNN74768.1 rhodanese-like domain-containing protein [Weissella diestrammenae]